ALTDMTLLAEVFNRNGLRHRIQVHDVATGIEGGARFIEADMAVHTDPQHNDVRPTVGRNKVIHTLTLFLGGLRQAIKETDLIVAQGQVAEEMAPYHLPAAAFIGLTEPQPLIQANKCRTGKIDPTLFAGVHKRGKNAQRRISTRDANQ